jgi:ATP-dependent DNA helicase RecQ
MNKAQELLLKHWGHHSFKDPQAAIIENVTKHQDSFVMLPTGAGKSLCYQLPSLLMDGICLVVSPLIALMEDQVQSLEKKGIRAMMLSSKLNRHETIMAFDNLQFGGYKFLYLSPEKLQSEFIQEKIAMLKLCLIAVDEAHCISEWGHDFRPAYMNIPALTALHPETPVIALTASATPRVKEDIMQHLRLENAQVFERSSVRPNLKIKILRTEDVPGTLYHLLKPLSEPAIVYVGTRKDSIYFSNLLNRQNIPATFYHGGLSNEEKTRELLSWKQESKQVMVATNAFGMGIDKANVRMIIHTHLPQSPENYMQEIGRAGRDQVNSSAVLLYNDGIIDKSMSMLDKAMAPAEFCKKVYTKLNDYYQIGKGELPESIFDFDLQEFSRTYKLPLLKTLTAINHLHHENVLFYNQNPNQRSRVRVIEKSNRLYEIQQHQKTPGKVLQLLLRNYGGIHDQMIAISEGLLAQKLNLTFKEIISALQMLDKDKVILYKRATELVQLRFLVPREDNFVYHTISGHVASRNKTKLLKSKAMLNLVENDRVCRQVQLLNYFGEKDLQECGLCDVCLAKNSTEPVNYRHMALKIRPLFKESVGLDAAEIAMALQLDKKDVVKTLQLLVESNSIRLNLQKKFEWVE